MSVKLISECRLPDTCDKPTLRRVISKSGDAALDRCTAEGNSSGLGNLLFEIIDTETCLAVSDLDINGSEIAAVTGKSGKEIGEALQMLLFAVFDEKVANNKSDLTEYLKKVDNTEKV